MEVDVNLKLEVTVNVTKDAGEVDGGHGASQYNRQRPNNTQGPTNPNQVTLSSSTTSKPPPKTGKNTGLHLHNYLLNEQPPNPGSKGG